MELENRSHFLYKYKGDFFLSFSPLLQPLLLFYNNMESCPLLQDGTHAIQWIYVG